MSLKLRLIVMNFLQFFVWGAWLLTIGAYWFQNRHWSGAGFGAIFSTMGIASLFMPALMGVVADKWINAERLYGILQILGAIALFCVPLAGDPQTLFWVMLINMCFYMPTIALAIAVSYNALKSEGLDVVRDYPPIRVWGTIGFIVPGLLLYFLIRQWHGISVVLYLASAIAVAGLINSMWLPSFGRPAAPRERRLPTAEAARALFKGQMLVFCAACFLLQMAAACYYSFYPIYLSRGLGVPEAWTGMVVNIGVGIEIVFMLAFGRITRWLGMRNFLLLGAALMALRMALLAAFPVPAVGIGTQAFHGMMVLLIHVAPVVMVNAVAGDSYRHSMQGLFAMLVLGGGRIVGNFIAGPIARRDYAAAYWWAASLCLVALALLWLFYEPPAVTETAA